MPLASLCAFMQYHLKVCTPWPLCADNAHCSYTAILWKLLYCHGNESEKQDMGKKSNHVARYANSEIAQLKSVVTNLQKHAEELQAKTKSLDVAEPSGPATPFFIKQGI
jgi:hypothetical protein